MEITINLTDEPVLSDRDDYSGGYQPRGTIEESIIAAAGRILADRVPREATDHLAARVKHVRDEVIREQLAPVIEAALEEPIQRTNEYGAPKGEPVLLRDLVLERAMAWLNETVGDHYSRPRKSRLDQVIHDQVDRSLTQELNQAIAEAKAKAVGTVREKAAEVLAETIRRSTPGL